MGEVININSALIVSSLGTFTEKLINKLDKEGWRVFTLVSDRFATKPPRVFEQYRFSYESDSMEEILASCRPNVILFMGAYDPLFSWTKETEGQDSRSFVAGLNNLLMAAREQSIRHFVYLSSECVFGDFFAGDIAEEMELFPSKVKATTIAQGETLATVMGMFSSLEVTVVRVADLYFIPKNRGECRDPCTRLCLEALGRGNIKVNAKIVRSALYIDDVVQALFTLFSAPGRKHRIYHLSSEQEVTELDIANIIKNTSARPVAIIDETTGFTKRRVLSAQRFAEEFAFQVRTTYAETIPKIVSYLEKHRRQFDLPRRKEGKLPILLKEIGETFIHFFPLIECVVFFYLSFFLESLKIDIPYLQNIDFYFIFVLLFAVIKGRVMAIVAFALATGGYFYQQILVQEALAFIMDSRTYIWIVELFLVGVTVGHLRDKTIRVQQEKEEESSFLQGRIENISFINETNTRIKNYFQERVISSNESIGWFYDIISQLDKAPGYEVIFIATDFLSRVMGSKDVAIYIVSEDDYCRLMASTTPRARSLGKSIYMESYKEFFQPLKNGQIFINRTLGQDFPSMAATILDDEGEAQVFFFLWDLPYERMTLYYSNTLRLLGSLVHNAMLRAADYMAAIAHKRLVPGTNILLENAFAEVWSFYERTENKQLIEYSMLSVPRGDLSMTEWNQTLNKILRQVDIIGLLPDHNIGILLTNTSKDEAALIVERIKAVGIPVNPVVD